MTTTHKLLYSSIFLFSILVIASLGKCGPAEPPPPPHKELAVANFILPDLQFQALVQAIRDYKAEASPQSNGSTQSWMELQRGKTLGKRSVVLWSGSTDGGNLATVDMLTVEGPNHHATQLNVTLSPPKFIRSSTALAGAGQSATGEQDNEELYPVTMPETTLPECSAIIDWGVGGVSQTAEVDFSNGASINITASFVRVRGKVTNGRNPDSTGGAIVLAAFVGPGWPKPDNAQRTISLATFGTGPAESIIFPIPRFAKKAQLQMGTTTFPPLPGLPPVPSSGYIRWWRSNKGIGAAFSPMGQSFFDDDIREPVIVPNGAYYFSVFNTTPPGPGPQNETNTRVVFDLNI